MFLDNNKWLAAFAFLFMSLGAKYVHKEFSDICHESYLDNMIMRKVILFCIFYVVTRELSASIIGVLIYTIAANVMYHTKNSNNNNTNNADTGNNPRNNHPSHTNHSTTNHSNVNHSAIDHNNSNIDSRD